MIDEKIDLVREQLQGIPIRFVRTRELDGSENICIDKQVRDWLVFPYRYAAIITYLGRRCT